MTAERPEALKFITDLPRKAQRVNGKDMIDRFRSATLAALAGAAAFGLLCFVCVAVHAQPSIRVRSATRVQLFADPGQDSVSLRGALLDDLGNGLPERSVQLRIDHALGADSEWQAIRTAADGSFGLTLPVASGRQNVFVRFGGESLYAATETTVPIDLMKGTVALRFMSPAGTPFDLDEVQQLIAVRASSASGAAGLEITLSNEQHTILGRSRTADDGVARFTSPSDALGPPGAGRLVATIAEDEKHSAAHAEIDVLRFLRTQVQLHATIDSARALLVANGQLRDRRGGLARKALGLYDGPHRIATVMTDARGLFRHSAPIVADSAEPTRTLRLQAHFASDAAWSGSSRSRIVVLELPRTAPPNALWAAAPLALCCVVFWMVARLSRRSAPRPDARPAVGVHPGSTVTGELARSIDCHVRDVRTNQAVPRAHCTLQADNGERIELTTDGRGHFRSAELSDGRWRLDVGASGYSTVSETFTIPHRGSWTNVHADLESRRDASIKAYKPVALRMLEAPELWGKLTPREMLRGAIRSGRATGEFASLTEQIEQATYAKDDPTPEDLASIERSADSMRSREPN